MTQMIPEAMPVAVTVSPVSYVEVVVEGPGGLKATLHSPDNDEAYDALPEFVAALPQAIEQGLEHAHQEAVSG